MNFRVFRSENDLHAALDEAIRRATASALSPHLGIVGTLEPWLSSLLSRSSSALRLAGHPGEVQRAIESDESIVAARAADLNEPLDLVIVVGPPPASVPSWLRDARSRFIASTRREDLSAWMSGRDDQFDRRWFFVLEDHWTELVGVTGEGSDRNREDPLNGDEIV